MEPDALGEMALIVSTSTILVGVFISPIIQSVAVFYASHAGVSTERNFRFMVGKTIRRRLLWISVWLAGCVFTLYLFGDERPLPFLAIIPLLYVDSMRLLERMFFACAGRHNIVAIVTSGDVSMRLGGVWLALAIFGGSASVAVLGNVIAAIFWFALVNLVAPLQAYPPDADSHQSWQDTVDADLRSFTRPLVPTAIVSNLTEMASRYVIAGTIGVHSAGLFVMAYGLVKRPFGMLHEVCSTLLLPRLGREHVVGSEISISAIRRLWFVLLIVTGIPAGALIILGRDQLVSLLLSPSYAPVSDLLPPLVFGIIVFNLAAMLDEFLLCLRAPKAVLVSRSASFVAGALFLLSSVANGDLRGAAWAVLASSATHFAISLTSFVVIRKTP